MKDIEYTKNELSELIKSKASNENSTESKEKSFKIARCARMFKDFDKLQNVLNERKSIKFLVDSNNGVWELLSRKDLKVDDLKEGKVRSNEEMKDPSSHLIKFVNLDQNVSRDFSEVFIKE